MIWRRKLGDEGAGLLPAPWEIAGVSEWEYWSGPSHRRPSHRIRRWHTVFGGTWDYGLARAATEFILGMLCWERRRGRRDVRLPVWGMRDPWSASARFRSAAAHRVSSSGVSSRRSRQQWVDQSWHARRSNAALRVAAFYRWRRLRWWQRAITDFYHLGSTVYWVGDALGERSLVFGVSIPRRWGGQVVTCLRHWRRWAMCRNSGWGEEEGLPSTGDCTVSVGPSHPPPGEGREIAQGNQEEECPGLADSILQLPVSSGLHHGSPTCAPQPQAAVFVPPAPLSRGEVPKQKKKKKREEQTPVEPEWVPDFPDASGPQHVEYVYGSTSSTAWAFNGAARYREELAALGARESDHEEPDAREWDHMDCDEWMLEEAPYEHDARMCEVLQHDGSLYACHC